MLSSHLRLGLPSGPFPSGFPTKTLYTPLLSPICAMAKHTHTYTQQIVFIAFVRQGWLRERDSLLHTLPILFNFVDLTYWSVSRGTEDVTLGRIHGDRKYGTRRRSEARRGCLLSISLKKLQLSRKFLLRRDFIGAIRILFARFEVFVFLLSDAASMHNRFLTFRENVVSMRQ